MYVINILNFIFLLGLGENEQTEQHISITLMVIPSISILFGSWPSMPQHALQNDMIKTVILSRQFRY
jgi:hypothetical protein